MRIIRTHEQQPNSIPVQWEKEQIYNGLDVCQTLEVFEVIRDQLDPQTSKTYAFSRALQGPVLEMRLRGVLVDQVRKMEVIDEFHVQLDRLESQLERIVFEGVGMLTFNFRSTADLKELFYTKLGIPPIRYGGRITCDRNAREKLQAYPIARQIVLHLNKMADLSKKISVLRTAIDPDGRIRTSYNIAGTTTGRFSSSVSEFGTGGNLQNVEEGLRHVLISDPGMKFAKFDAKSGESFCVGAIIWNLFHDESYLLACETGDPHTAVARLCWPNLPWTGNLKADKDLAETPFYRHYTYRFMCKKLGHGSNYGGLPQTLATQTKLGVNLVREFQPKYFSAFPGITKWHEHVENELYTKGCLISLTGRKRYFMGRRQESSTLREAIAYDPQCSLAEIVNQAMLNIYHARDAVLMLQDHDAVTIQYPEILEDEIIPKILKQLIVPVPLAHGRTMTIPFDCKTGWNRGDYSDKNPEGLKDYVGTDTRTRAEKTHFLDRLVHRVQRQYRFAKTVP